MTKDEIKEILEDGFEQNGLSASMGKLAYTVGFITGIRKLNSNGISNCFEGTTDGDLLDLLIESIRDNLLDRSLE